MNRKFRFHPDYKTIGSVCGHTSIEELSKVVSVYAASPEFAIQHCGPLVENILARVPQFWYDECRRRKLLPNVDVRVHRLYRGIYPAFPGWHCDAEFRESYFGQPELDRTPVSKTIVCTVSSHPEGISNTRFLNEELVVSVEESEEQALWRQVHEKVESKARSTWDAPDGCLINFSNRTLHKAMPTVRRGWRLFFRMSMWHKPYLEAEGKISKQEQVYQVLESQGW